MPSIEDAVPPSVLNQKFVEEMMCGSLSFRGPMFLIGPRNLLCIERAYQKQIPRCARNDTRTYATI